MAKKNECMKISDDIPQDLSKHKFFGLILDEQQRAFRDAIWDKDKLIIFVDAKAGTGKTQIATATAELLVKYGLYEGITYISTPVQEHRQGFLPGSLTEKSSPYHSPFYQALKKIDVNLNTCMVDDINNLKSGTAYITCQTHTFMRGENIENQVVIIDEMQNYTLEECKKTLTRIHDNCKVICIGHTEQIDLINKSLSGFKKYIEHFSGDDRVAICELTKNYRGWISTWADSIKY